jgi:hypothetical protein
MKPMHLTLALTAAIGLTACGMAETSGVAAAQAENAIEQAKEGEKKKAQIEEDIAAAQEQAKQARDALDQ